LKTKRLYNGFEVERDLHYNASLRLARAVDVFEREVVSTKKRTTEAGLVDALQQQVFFVFGFVLFFVLCFHYVYLMISFLTILVCRSVVPLGLYHRPMCHRENTLGVRSYPITFAKTSASSHQILTLLKTHKLWNC
jgi:hypothetical protein